jgi:hypothetical protein
MKEAFDGAIRLLFLVGLTFIVLLVLLKAGHCATTSTQKEHNNNAFGAVIYQENPYAYIAGYAGEVFEVGSHQGMVLRVQPISTYEQFTVDILFCGYPVDLFQGKENPIVLVFEKQDHRMIQGIGCHRLVAVKEIKPERKVQQ